MSLGSLTVRQLFSKFTHGEVHCLCLSSVWNVFVFLSLQKSDESCFGIFFGDRYFLGADKNHIELMSCLILAYHGDSSRTFLSPRWRSHNLLKSVTFSPCLKGHVRRTKCPICLRQLYPLKPATIALKIGHLAFQVFVFFTMIFSKNMAESAHLSSPKT